MFNETTIETYTCSIYVGLLDIETLKQYTSLELKRACEKYCTTAGLCVSIFPCTYSYIHGTEDGARIDLITYPRFPKAPEKIRDQAIDLAKFLMTLFRQRRCSIVCPEKTIMLEQVT